jgi:hypothetical protein
MFGAPADLDEFHAKLDQTMLDQCYRITRLLVPEPAYLPQILVADTA